jgi:hypothetical protein
MVGEMSTEPREQKILSKLYGDRLYHGDID